MSEQLNVLLVKELLREKGLRLGWVYKHIGLGTTAGTLMINRGVLPTREELRKTALARLAALLGVSERKLVLRLEAKTA
jgi:hypothetical protein